MTNLKAVIIFILMAVVSCKSNSQIDVQGHRGSRGIMPENTIPAFEKAIDLGVTTLELDVVISKDHMVVVSHEPYMNHEICSGIGGSEIMKQNEKSFNLYAMTYDSITKYDCGLKGNPRFLEQKKLKTHKPLLSDVIEMAEQKSAGNIKYNIELKSSPNYDGVYSPDIETFVSLVISEISRFSLGNRFNLQSFDLRALEEIHKQAPNIATALLVEGEENIENKLASLSFKPEILSPYFGLLNETVVKKYHDKGFQIIPWTINDGEEMKRMIALKVDGIITDYPNLLIELLGR